MAKKNVKIKGVWFNLDLPNEIELCKYADSINFSDWVKAKLREDKHGRGNCPEESKLDPQEIAELVESLLETKLAGRIMAVDQAEDSDIEIDMDQFF
jgi:hypothetical protein